VRPMMSETVTRIEAGSSSENSICARRDAGLGYKPPSSNPVAVGVSLGSEVRQAVTGCEKTVTVDERDGSRQLQKRAPKEPEGPL